MMNKKTTTKKWLCILLLIFTAHLFPDEKPVKKKQKVVFDKLEFSIGGGELYHYKIRNKEVRYPPYLERMLSHLPFYKKGFTALDNPLGHGALYFDLNMTAEIKGFTLRTKLIAEHRGMSYGVYDTQKMEVYPKINIAYNRSFKIGSRKSELGLALGNFDDYRLFEGLTIYNIDVQGNDLFWKWGKFKLALNRIADLEYGIGLGINDEEDYILSLENIVVTKHLQADIKAGVTVYRPGGYRAVSISGALHNGENFRLYSQIGLMYGKSGETTFKGRSALLVGAKYRKESTRLKIFLTGEYRFYGNYFNLFFNEGGAVNYFGGEILYPIYNYDRFFSQWAVFTDYQNVPGTDNHVSGLTLQFKGRYYPLKEVFCFAALDFNYIMAKGESPFLYPFYDTGFGIEPISNVLLYLNCTNKGMDLTRHYPTFYLYKRPAIGFSVRFRFSLE